MNEDRRPIVAGNWKMNKTIAEALALVRGLRDGLANVDVTAVDIVVCPPFTALSEVGKAIRDSDIQLGAQNMSENSAGAYTGEIAAEMLKEVAVRYVILGHSERRQYQKESDALIAKKAQGALMYAMIPFQSLNSPLSPSLLAFLKTAIVSPGDRCSLAAVKPRMSTNMTAA